MSIANGLGFLLITAAVSFGIGLLAFWIWMLVDCMTKESREGNDRLLWAVVIVFTKIFGAGLYYFLRYRKRGTPDPTALTV